jgi:Right handed beta helix region
MRRLLLVLSPLTLAVLFAVPAAPALAGTGQHAAITITSNAGFSTCACGTSGSGTAADPFVIGPWAIGAPSGGTSGWSVKIDNSGGGITDHFNISGISSTYNNTSTTDPTIWLVGVNTPTSIVGTNAHPTAGNDLGIGIELDGSSNVAIDGVSYNKGNGTGIYLNGSSNVSINNSKLKATCDICTPHTGDGIYAVNSANLQIGTGPDCPRNAPCNDVTYDDGFGIWLVNTHDVVIDHATADANDTGGYVLDGSNTYNVTLENSGAQGDGNICFTINGQRANSGYFTDLQGGLHLVNGAHNNTIANDTFTGSTGLDVASGGNRVYNNACTGVPNQPFSPVEAPMGSGNTFSNICYSHTNIAAALPPSTCKS